MIFEKDKYRRKGRSVCTGNNQYVYTVSESHVKVVAPSDTPTQMYHSTLYSPSTEHYNALCKLFWFSSSQLYCLQHCQPLQAAVWSK